jgi:hypothetical protein
MADPKMGKRAHSPCVTRTLARGDVARIDVCDDCGVLVLHLGPVSLRVKRDALRSLGATVADAMRQLEGGNSNEMLDDPDTTGVRRKWVARGRA